MMLQEVVAQREQPMEAAWGSLQTCKSRGQCAAQQEGEGPGSPQHELLGCVEGYSSPQRMLLCEEEEETEEKLPVLVAAS